MSMYNWRNEQKKESNTYFDDSIGQEPIVIPEEQAQPGNNEQSEQPQVVPMNKDLYKTEAGEVASDIYTPLIEGAEKGKEAIDLAAQMQIEGIQKTIPYVTRQFEAYQAKAGLGTGMQSRMSNQLIMDIAETVGQVYKTAELEKYAVDSKISEYQSAMAAGEYEIATQMYNQALSEAQFMSDYLGTDFIQPEIGYVYDQMTVAQQIIQDPNSTPEEIEQAKTSLSNYEKSLKDLGYSGEIGQGLRTYQQQKEDLQAFYQEAADLFQASSFEVQYASVLQTNQAFLNLIQGTMTFEEALTAFPGADYEKILELQQDMQKGDISVEDILAGLQTTTPQETP